MGVEKVESVGLGGSTTRQKPKGQETAGSQGILGSGNRARWQEACGEPLMFLYASVARVC